MIVFDFIYFSIYTLVPDKAIFGKRDVACTYYSSFTALFLFMLFINCAVVFKLRISVALSAIMLFGGLFILARVIYLKPEKFKSMHRRFRRIPKWLLKTMGIMYMVLCFVGIILLRIFTYHYFEK
jgi:uncharacterized membrane protein YjjP (DUF1212 family)